MKAGQWYYVLSSHWLSTARLIAADSASVHTL